MGRLTRILAAALLLAPGLAAPALAADGPTVLISVGKNGVQGDDDSLAQAISADGRFVVFYTRACNLVPVPADYCGDEYDHTVAIRDRREGTTLPVALGPSGKPGHGASAPSAMTPDGRFVVFWSYADDLVRGDKSFLDVFVRDRRLGKTSQASVGTGGIQGDDQANSEAHAISDDGRYVAFDSSSSNLVPHDRNYQLDVFRHDRKTGVTVRVSVSSKGQEGNARSYVGPMTADGRYVFFFSDASNLVPGDTNEHIDLFRRDLKLNKTIRVSLDEHGKQLAHGNECCGRLASSDGRIAVYQSFGTEEAGQGTKREGGTFVRDLTTGVTTRLKANLGGLSDISADGRFILFTSDASDLVPGDTNGKVDVFVYDRQTGRAKRVNVGPGGRQANGLSYGEALSPNGKFVVFSSDAMNLVDGDKNGHWDAFLRELDISGKAP